MSDIFVLDKLSVSLERKKKSQRQSHHISKCILSTWHHWGYKLWSSSWDKHFSDFSITKLFATSSTCYSLWAAHQERLILKEAEFHLLDVGSYIHKLLGILLYRNFSLLSDWFISSVIIFMDSGYLFCTLSYNPVAWYLLCCQIGQVWPLELYSWLLCPFDIPQCFAFLNTSINFLSGYTGCCRLMLYVPHLFPKICHISKSPGSF